LCGTTDDVFYRCNVCQEQVTQGGERHCEYCHTTWTLKQMPDEELAKHVQDCKKSNDINTRTNTETAADRVHIQSEAEKATIQALLEEEEKLNGRRRTRSSGAAPVIDLSVLKRASRKKKDDDDEEEEEEEEIVPSDSDNDDEEKEGEGDEATNGEEKKAVAADGTATNGDDTKRNDGEAKMDQSEDKESKAPVNNPGSDSKDPKTDASSSSSSSSLSSSLSSLSSSPPATAAAAAGAGGATTSSSSSSTTTGSGKFTRSESLQRSSSLLIPYEKKGKGATCLANVSERTKAIKAALFDIEAALPREAMRDRTSKAREAWLSKTKTNYSIQGLAARLQELELGTKPTWLMSWFDSDKWTLQLSQITTEAQLALHVFIFDRAVIYSDIEFAADKGETDDPNEAADGACQICHKGHKAPQLIGCDTCDEWYHTFCLMPPLSEVPKGDWHCPACRRSGKVRAATPTPRTSKKKSGSRAPATKKRTRADASDKEDDDNTDDAADVNDNNDDEDEDEPKGRSTRASRARARSSPSPSPARGGYCKKCTGQTGDTDNPLKPCSKCDYSYHLECVTPALKRFPRADWICPSCALSSGRSARASARSAASKRRPVTRIPPTPIFPFLLIHCLLVINSL
jgi:Mg-chelatase subunit ChlI